MSARFRIVHFMPDPVTGARVPVAAIVEGEDQHVELTRAGYIPDPRCLGGRAAWSVVELALEVLEKSPALGGLPSGIGPHFFLGEERGVPDQVSNPAEWVRQRVLSAPLVKPADTTETVPRAPKRQHQGMKFFENFKVAQYVRSTFDGLGFHVHESAAHPISHYVLGKKDLLLMEPVVGMREDLKTELRDISQIFLAWQTIFHNRPLGQQPRFIAYVLGGAHRGSVTMTREAMAESRAEVIQVDVPTERDHFVEQIRRIGRSLDSGNLPLN